MSKEIAEEYASSLADLTVNSKPLINMLTILAEENIDHAGVIVETVEKHLEKVNPEIKLPVLYLVDSIIKNVGGAYTQKFASSIVNMFTKTFKQVDEKIRSQMFKLRETWHDVFPATKLYQLDVKVNLIDPAWPIQAQPHHQSNIHVNPNFLKKTATTTPTTSAVIVPEDDEKMRNILAKKEQELLMLQKKKVEMELEQMKRQLELDKGLKKIAGLPASTAAATSMPVAKVNPVVSSVLAPVVLPTEAITLPVKQRLGPPVNKSSGRIAPVSGALAAARRDPRLARRPPHAVAPRPTHAVAPRPPHVGAPRDPNQAAPPVAVPIAPNDFDIKPLPHVTKRKNVITIDVRTDRANRRDPRLDRAERQARRRDQPRKSPVVPPTPAPPPVVPPAEDILEKLQAPDPRRINKLPPIPKINRSSVPSPPAPKRKKEGRERKRREDKEEKSSSGSSPEKGRTGAKVREARRKVRPETAPTENVPIAFKELKNYHKERYMRRNKEKSESPERPEVPAVPLAAPAVPPESEPSNVADVPEAKDVDLRVLPVVEPKPAAVSQKRPSTEALEGKPKKNKLDKFDILFGNEDVDLRQLPQVEEVNPPPPPVITDTPASPKNQEKPDEEEPVPSPKGSPKKDWNEVKEKKKDDTKKTPSKLDLVRAKLAEATKGKDRLGRPLLFAKSPSVEKERRRTLSSEDTDLRAENNEDKDFDAEDHKKTISIIMSQAKEQYTDGSLDKNQYNALMYQVLQLNEKLKLKEAKQRESLEISKRKLKAHIEEENKVASPKSSPNERNRYGDIDERVTPSVFVDTPHDSQGFMKDSDMRMADGVDGKMDQNNIMPYVPQMAPGIFPGPNPGYVPMWRGQIRPRNEEYGPRRFRGPAPFFRAKFDKRGPRVPFDVPRMPIQHLPTPQLGMCQGECPLKPYERVEPPPPIGTPNVLIPPTDFRIIEYIDQDPVKTIQIDGIPREIRFYGDTAVIMLDWDDPREIKFLPGCRRATFDNKDSVVLSFNEDYKQVEIEDQVFDIKYGAPTRELYINRRWHECFFGGAPLGVIIDGKARLVHLEGPLPQVDIGKEKRTDLVAGKINLIVNATQMCPVYLDAKVQKFMINNQYYTIRFVDALRTVLINEQPFKVEFGDLPKPIFVGNEKHFIRFSALPRNIKPGYVQIVGMEGSGIPTVMPPPPTADGLLEDMEVDEPPRPVKTPSPEVLQENQGLDMLASVMPTAMEFASGGSDYSVANPTFTKNDKIPGLETPVDEKQAPVLPGLPGLGNINVTDLFAKLVATGIVQVPNNTDVQDKKEEAKQKPKEDRSVIHRVDLLKPETLRVKQPGLVTKLYGGMQCSGCGCRFPPEQTVRYSQHLDWHFRQNRRERDSARRAHSRHWHYDLTDWLQYEEIDEIDDREKNWFECNGEEQPCPMSPEREAPSVAAGAPADCRCAMCGDKFDQFYNEDQEEWHLRNSVRHHDLNYHPICYDDYKASLTKEEPPKEELEESTVDKTEEAIEINDGDDLDQSDNESVVEVVETDDKSVEQCEILENDEDDGDDDDVVLKAEPVEEVVVEDADTDDETTEQRGDRDRRAAEDFARVKVKQEPLDPDDEPVITAEDEIIPTVITSTHNTVFSSIDGNMQLDELAPPGVLPTGGIRINISKTIPTFISSDDHQSMLEDISADDEPLPPGEEPELDYKLKPELEGIQFSRQPPVQKGSELSGLCSIM